MCLAKVMVRKNEENSVFAKNISNIKIDGNLIVLTDIIGKEYEVEGSIIMADLVNGEVLIKST
jgi:predicted RNA-binding protein